MLSELTNGQAFLRLALCTPVQQFVQVYPCDIFILVQNAFGV